MLSGLVSDASWVIIRIEFDGEHEWFGGYVAVDVAGKVLEKSDAYGVYEEDADDFDGYGDACLPATREAFMEAWDRPYAQRSLKRRILARMNGAIDSRGDPSQRDRATPAE
jgi:hypothetical protein